MSDISVISGADGKISDKLLDLADRIPYNSVRESTAAVWDHFRIKTENCKNAAQLAQQLVWFSKQILPRVLRTSWAPPAAAAAARQATALDLWRDRCGVLSVQLSSLICGVLRRKGGRRKSSIRGA
jgi:hypothetical protein